MSENQTHTIDPVDWSVVRYYSESDFSYPDKLDHKIVSALDSLVDILGNKPEVIDDWRDTKEGWHPTGLALDIIVHGLDSLEVLDKIRGSKLFTGFGLYTNENNVQSFHVDRRTDRDFNDPATWGGWKDRTKGVEVWQYVGLQDLIEVVKKNKSGSLLLAAGLTGLALWWLFSE